MFYEGSGADTGPRGGGGGGGGRGEKEREPSPFIINYGTHWVHQSLQEAR